MNEQSKNTTKQSKKPRETKVTFSKEAKEKLKEIEFPESVIKNIAKQISKHY